MSSLAHTCPLRFFASTFGIMTAQPQKIVLGSCSPRRLELLRQVVSTDRIEVLPPQSSEEPAFDGLPNWPDIQNWLSETARSKCDDVLRQLRFITGDRLIRDVAVVIAADTIIVAADADGKPVVLGQPPEDSSGAETVRRWFRDYYFGATHTAATALCVATPLGRRAERVVESAVSFYADTQRWLDWYIATGEPRGKAGGYALQGAGGLFVSQVKGSISNVVGLPLRELLEVLEELEVDVSSKRTLSEYDDD